MGGGRSGDPATLGVRGIDEVDRGVDGAALHGDILSQPPQHVIAAPVWARRRVGSRLGIMKKSRRHRAGSTQLHLDTPKPPSPVRRPRHDAGNAFQRHRKPCRHAARNPPISHHRGQGHTPDRPRVLFILVDVVGDSALVHFPRLS